MQKEKMRIKGATQTKPLYYAVRATGIERLFNPAPIALGNAVAFTQAPAKVLKRKASSIGRPTQATIMQNTPVTTGESIVQQLTKKKRSDESITSLFTLMGQISNVVATPLLLDTPFIPGIENSEQMDANIDGEL